MSRLIKARSILRQISRLDVFRSSLLPKATNASRLLLIATPPVSVLRKQTEFSMDDFDLKLQSACERGDAAIIEFMDFLKMTLVQLAKAYKESLNKQIQLIDQATKAGESSTKWDELPEYRTLAADLNQQFQTMVSTIHTLGSLTKNEAMKYIIKNEKQIKLIDRKYKELSKVIKSQCDEIKNIEKKLLQKNKKSIEQAS